MFALAAARSRVHLCPEKKPIVVPRLTQAQTQKHIKHQQGPTTSPPSTSPVMIVITHGESKPCSHSKIYLSPRPLSQEQEAKFASYIKQNRLRIGTVAPNRSNHHQPQNADDIAVGLL